MGVVLGIFEQVLLLGSLLLFTGFVFYNATHGTNSMELALRVSSLFAGALVVVGAQAAGLSFASFTVGALSSTHPTTAVLSKVAGTVVPGGLGVGMGWYLTRSLYRSQNIAMRIMAFVGMLAASQFAAIYVIATSRRGVQLGATALPNIFFVVGILLYMMLKYDPSRARQTRSASVPGIHNLPRFMASRLPFVPQQRPGSSAFSSTFQEANDQLYRSMNQPGQGTGRTNGEGAGR